MRFWKKSNEEQKEMKEMEEKKWKIISTEIRS